MLKRLLIGWFAALALAPLSAYALGLGSIEVKSSLTETMDAVIEVVGAEPGDAAGMRVRLAPPEQFRRAGIDRGFHLTNLRFAVEEEPDTELPYIKVTSRQALKEPLLNFIVELASNDGLVFKEYVVFLDPPGLPSSVAPLVAPMAPPAESATQALPPGLPPATTAASEAPPQAVAGEAIARDSSYGPTHEGDTLWKIASHYASSANEINPLMMAIVEANPSAFIGGNAHGLLPGQVLRLPDQAAVDAISNAEAIAALRRQESAWRTASGRSSDGKASGLADESGVVERGSPGPVTPPAAGKPDAAERPATVRLVRDDREDVPSADAASAAGTGDLDTVSGEARQQVLLLEEQLDSQRQENDELKDRISALENQIARFQQLIEELENRDGMRAPGPVDSAPEEGSQRSDVEDAESADSSYGQRTDGQEPASDGSAFDEEGLDEAPLPEDPLAGIGGDTGIGIDDDSASVAQSADDATPVDQPATEIDTAPPEATEKPAEPQPATRAPPPVPVAPPAPGLVDVLLANLVPIGGGIVVLVLLVFGVRTLRKRRGESVAAPVTELDDADDTYVAP
ncbi:MAG: FimV/HubP family polar landmark protein, partial [Pseudomonadota bacterium]|nr:FimV/HubP family polar landmark protein [Pseudomonadota bacterium]